MKKKNTAPAWGEPKQICRSTLSGIVPGKADAFVPIRDALIKYQVGETTELPDDGYIGIPVSITVYTKDGAYRTPKKPKDAHRIDDETEPNNYKFPPEQKMLVLYLININVPRIGTDSDVSIIQDMLDRGFHVAVIDYHNELRAKAPDLDWSMIDIRLKMQEGEYMHGLTTIKGYNYFVPEGYNIKCGLKFYDYCENGVDGIEDFIVDIWNTALHRRSGRFAKGEQYEVIWGEKRDRDGNPILDADGKPVYKAVTEDAVWEDEKARRIKVCYTVAEHYWDCVKCNGDPIDTGLYLDITYPTKPRHKVPVMMHHSSSETRNEVNTRRPILSGYLLRGYAGVTFDHAYCPMARRDHFGYFEGDIPKNRRMDFTFRFVAGMEALTAPIRLIRKLAELYPEYGLDGNAIGAWGHSKGAPVNIMATEHPELQPKENYLPGYHGELTRPQPNTHYEDGTPIPSNLQMCYSSNGGGGCYIFPDQAPTVITQGECDGPFHSSSHYGQMLATLRSLDRPVLDMSMPTVGHTTIYGYSDARDFDMYNALFEFTDYYLKKAPSVCEYILPTDGTEDVCPTSKIRIKFTGEYTKEEIEKNVFITRKSGESVSGLFEGHFSGNEWTFTPTDLVGGDTVTVSVSEQLTDKRGQKLARARRVTYQTECEATYQTQIKSGRSVLEITFPRPKRRPGDRIYLRLFAEDSIGRIAIYSSEGGYPIATAGTARTGRFDIDITDYIAKNRKRSISLLIKPMKEKHERELIFYPFDLGDEVLFETSGARKYPYDDPAATPPKRPAGEIAKLPDGSGYALSIAAGRNAFLHDFIPLHKISDLGKKWRIEFDAMSPEGRSVHSKIICRNREDAPCYMDYYTNSAVLGDLTPGEWSHICYTYAPDDEAYLNPDHIKTSLTILGTASQVIECDRLYVKNLRLTELSGVATIDTQNITVVVK